MKKDCNVLIVGLGLSASFAAARLHELGVTDIVMCGAGLGASPDDKAINFVTPDNPYGDTPDLFAEDFLNIGCHIQCEDLIYKTTAYTNDCYELLLRWGINDFARDSKGALLRRQTCGSRFPRTLYCEEEYLGSRILRKIHPTLEKKGVSLIRNCFCVRLLYSEGKVIGATVQHKENGQLQDIYAPVTIAAWGGVGLIFGEDPDMPQGLPPARDIKGNTLGMAWKLGAKVVDAEFLEFEPTVIAYPPEAMPGAIITSILSDGAKITNSKGERFLFSVRPEGEVGVPKSVLNRENMRQVRAGNGGPHGGVFVDLSDIDISVLNSYNNYYDHLLARGCDLKKVKLEIVPQQHSHSGGLLVDKHYQTTLPGLYAIGEAMGGFQGADRAGGSGAAQAILSGYACAESVSQVSFETVHFPEIAEKPALDTAIRNRYLPTAQSIGRKAMSVIRTGSELLQAEKKLEELYGFPEIAKDVICQDTVLSMLLMIKGALARKESRGVHVREDFPEEDPSFAKGIIL